MTPCGMPFETNAEVKSEAGDEYRKTKRDKKTRHKTRFLFDRLEIN